MKIQEYLTYLTSNPGLSGAEESIATILCEKLKKLGLEPMIDSYGNVHGSRRIQDKNAKTVLLEAHMDQIGLMVSGIDENGFIQFVNLGGVDERILPGMEVTIFSNPPIKGIIGGFSPKAKEGEDTKNPALKDYRIDTGLDTESAKKSIHPGDFIQIGGETCELLHGRMSGCAMDNRAGVVAILACLEELAQKEPAYHIEVLFSTQEELGLHGAYTGIQPGSVDAAIAVDVTHGTTPDVKNETGVFPLGSGAVICRGPNLHYQYTKQLISLAKEYSVSHEIEVASGGSGTTAWAIQIIGNGIPVMLVSIPLRYMHTNVETLEISDVEAVSKLLYLAVMGGIQIV